MQNMEKNKKWIQARGFMFGAFIGLLLSYSLFHIPAIRSLDTFPKTVMMWLLLPSFFTLFALKVLSKWFEFSYWMGQVWAVTSMVISYGLLFLGIFELRRGRSKRSKK